MHCKRTRLTNIKNHIRNFIARQPRWFFLLFASFTSFLTYSCMYAFRKPFTIGEFQGITILGADYKIWLITAQVTGYTLSKFLGIRYIATLKASQRALSIAIFIGIAELALYLFNSIPPPYNLICLFFNGLPLGLIWGIVFSYLEGRQITEVLGAALSASFIIASGVVKSAGTLVMQHLHATEFSMPYITGLFFATPLLVSVYLLDCIPPPTKKDEQERTKRQPMNREARIRFVKSFFPAIVLLVITYIFLTIFRELRDNFAIELWKTIGYSNNAAIFTRSELVVAAFTLIFLAMIVFIRDNFTALNTILWQIISGFILVFMAALLYHKGLVSGTWWMVLTGTGLYLGYVPFNAFLYERLISAFRVPGNIGFIIYISDSFGYLGSLGVLFFKNFMAPSLSWIDFFIRSGMWLSLIGIFLIFLTMLYLHYKYYQKKLKLYGFRLFPTKPILTANPGTSEHQ